MLNSLLAEFADDDHDDDDDDESCFPSQCCTVAWDGVHDKCMVEKKYVCMIQ